MREWAFGHAPDPDPFRADTVCRVCGRRLVSAEGGTYMRHAGPVCGAPMRYGERCARQRGHADTHRSRYALDNQAVSRRRDLIAA